MAWCAGSHKTVRDADGSVRVGIASSGGMLLDAEARRRGVSGDDTAAQRGSRWGGRLTTGARGGYCEAVSFTGIRRPYETGHPGRRNDDGTGVSQE